MTRESHLQAAYCDLVADVAQISGKVQLRVGGFSMAPALWPGDLVTIARCDPSELQPNSIIVFRQNERLVIHRFIRWAGDRVVTRGDARPRCDEPVTVAEVLGRVESILRNGRQIVLQPSFWQRGIAAVLRRSEWFTWLFLRVSCRLRRFEASKTTLGPVDTTVRRVGL
jgi:signal peptidase I